MENGPPILILNIRGVVLATEHYTVPVKGSAMRSLPILEDAWLLLSGGFIEDYGRMSVLSDTIQKREGLIQINARGKFIFPSFCDSHSHIVFAGSREKEFVDKIQGISYEEIARKGGGILNSAKKVNQASEEELYHSSLSRVKEVMAHGTGAIEIKSGYGLKTDAELKILRVIRKLKNETPLQIKATFLGAHTIPEAYKSEPDEYVDLVINEMIPCIAAENLADYIDVFCDTGFFSIEQTERILMAGLKYGLRPKLHANQLGNSGGVQVGVKYNALSVDHLENIEDEEIHCLLESETIPVLLPGAVFFLRSSLPPARRMIEAGLPLAIASDFNPGSCPSGNMKLVLSLACILLQMLPAESIHAATINGAFAMGLEDVLGTISKGKIANLFITKEMPSLDFFPYAFGSDLIDTIILSGRIIKNISEDKSYL
jgi:imidazolonepropionase